MREGERQRKADEREASARRKQGDERQLLIDVLHEMRDAGAELFPLSLEITEAEVGARVPWLVVGRFDAVGDVGYADLFELFALWRDDIQLEARIHPQRFSQIRIVYSDPNAKRGDGDSIVSTAGAWEAVIGEQTHEIDPDDDSSLSNRYKHTTVPHFYVYFAGYLATDRQVPVRWNV